MNDALLTFQHLDPMLQGCVFIMAITVGLYLIVITHPRVKPPQHGVYYNSQGDDSIPPTQPRADKPTTRETRDE